MNLEKKLYAVRDVANVLGITPRTVWRWVENKEFPEPDIKKGDQFLRWRECH